MKNYPSNSYLPAVVKICYCWERLKFMLYNTRFFKTQLSVEECLFRFRKLVPENMLSEQSNASNVQGSLKGKKFRLYKQRGLQRNAFSPVFVGEFLNRSEQTTIKIRSQAPISSILFILFAYIFFIFASISSHSFAPMCFCIPVTVFFVLGLLWARSEEENISSFISNTFEAQTTKE